MLFQFYQLTLILKLPPGLCFQKVFNSSRCDKKQKLVKSFTIFFRALNEPQLEEQWAFTGFYNWWQTKFYLPSVKARQALVRSVRRRVYCLNCANCKTFSYFQVSYFLSEYVMRNAIKELLRGLELNPWPLGHATSILILHQLYSLIEKWT